jgi:adenine-specific DNA methylase
MSERLSDTALDFTAALVAHKGFDLGDDVRDHVCNALSELRDRRSRDLTADEVGALLWAKAVVCNHVGASGAAVESRRAAIAVLDKLLTTHTEQSEGEK